MPDVRGAEARWSVPSYRKCTERCMFVLKYLCICCPGFYNQLKTTQVPAERIAEEVIVEHGKSDETKTPARLEDFEMTEQQPSGQINIAFQN